MSKLSWSVSKFFEGKEPVLSRQMMSLVMDRLQVLDTDLFYIWFPDLGRHPTGSIVGALDLIPFSSEKMDTLGTLFTKAEVCIAFVGYLKSCLSWALAGEYAIFFSVYTKGEVASVGLLGLYLWSCRSSNGLGFLYHF
jgi:hypothetical protein